MKYIHIIALIVCLLSVATPHRAAASELFDAAVPNKVVELNPHIGVGMSSLLQNYGTAVPGMSDFLLSPGCMVNFGMDVRFVIRNSIALGTGLVFNINNSRMAMNLLDNATGSISSIYLRNHFYDFTVPVYITCRLNIGRKMQWSLDGGIYMSHGTGGDVKVSGYTSGVNSLNQPVVTHASYKHDYFNSKQPLVNSVKRFDWGPRIATGLIYNHRYTLNAIFQVSSENLAQNRGVLDVSYRNISLQFQLGYLF